MTKEMKQTVRAYLFLQGTSAFGISFISAFYVTFLLAKGLNYFQANLVNVFFWTTLFVCELPTGAFADVFGRKLSFVISCTLFGLGMIVYGFANTFWGFVGAEMVIAVGQTFSSGAFQAWLVDRLRQQGFQGSFARIFSRKQQVTSTVSIFSAILGAFLGAINMTLPWFVGGSVMFIAAVLASSLMQEEVQRAPLSFLADLKRMKEVSIAGMGHSLKHPAVKFILAVGAFQAFAIQAPNMQWQPLFQPYLASAAELGYVKAAISIFIMVGAAIAPFFLRKIKNERIAILLIQTGIGLGIAASVASKQFGIIVMVFMSHEVIRGMYDPLKDAYLHDNIPSDKRATIASCDSMAMRLGGVIGLLVSGALAQYFSIPVAWIVSGGVLVVMALALSTRRSV